MSMVDLSDRQKEIIRSYLILSKGDKIDYNFVCFHSEVDDIIELLNK